MIDKVWTREALTEQILKDTAGLWRHIDDEAEPRSGRELLASVRGGCVALIEGGQVFDTRDLLTLAVCMLDLIRAATLETQAKAPQS
jgi:hypothetical protein